MNTMLGFVLVLLTAAPFTVAIYAEVLVRRLTHRAAEVFVPVDRYL